MPWYDKLIFWGKKASAPESEAKVYDQLQHPPRPQTPGPRPYFEYFTNEGPVGISWSARAYFPQSGGGYKTVDTMGIGNDMDQARRQAQEAGHRLLKENTQ